MAEQNAENTAVKSKRKPESEDEKIRKLEEKLKKLKDEKKRKDDAARERNAKAIMAFLKTERLDTVEIEKWQSALEKIKGALGYEAPDQ